MAVKTKTTFKTYNDISAAQQKAEEVIKGGGRVVAIRGRIARVLGIAHKVWEVQIER